MPGPAATSFTNGPNIKLGAMKKKCSSGLSQWALRYLILDKTERILYYYKTPKDASPRRALDLSTCTISRLTAEESAKEPGFKVSIPNVRDFIFVGNAALVVDDWVNCLFQAKAPTQTLSPNNVNRQSTAESDQGGDFGYNGPTLAVLPGRKPTQEQNKNAATNVMANATQNAGSPVQPQRTTSVQQANSARSTQSSIDDKASQNNTLVAGQNDTNSTLVAGLPGPNNSKKPAPNTPVTFIILTPDNKKFPPIERPVTGILKIGRFVGSAPQADDMITFKSKVISRHHAEIWTVNNEIYIRDCRSQSGTFLNAMRLSEPSKESKPYRLKPGDVIQFGVDYKGATEDNARCISVRVDLKQKMFQSPGNYAPVVAGQGGEETLIGGNTTTNSEGATLIGNAGSQGQTKVSVGDSTLVQDGRMPQQGFNPQPMANNMMGNPSMRMNQQRPPMQQPMMRPGMMQPGMTMMNQPMMSPPGMMQPGMMQPGMIQPGMMQRPMMQQPGMTMMQQPGMMMQRPPMNMQRPPMPGNY